MNEDKNQELIFKDYLSELVDSFGRKSQEGAKAAIRECQETFGYVSISREPPITEVTGF